MQALGARQQLFSAACKDLRQPIPTKLHTLKAPGTFSPMLASSASHARCPVSTFASSAASPAGEEFDFDYEAEDPQGKPLTADPSTSYALPDDDAESRALAVAIGKVCWETKGEDLMVLHVAPLVYWTRYMVIATVFSRPQLNAMLAKIEKEAEETFDRRPASPAAGTSAWELLDYGDVVVHVLTADQREYYDLESFYGAAEEVDLPFVVEGQNQAPAWETKLES
ncbi:hypothetical protein Ndes2526B_g07976 [Nannochloris sp. 'desiccata']|nr:hypothetical protein KSW81_002621 [Chlorella desiccata (nom. nud.)]KAH7617374.1 putative Protein Iojap, chloroplastic [Chlorella desiccata (nom. nud.)]